MELKVILIAYYVIFVTFYAIKRVEASKDGLTKIVSLIMFTIFFPFMFALDIAMIVNKINKEL